MSLEKAILHGKERRKPYTDVRRFVRSCRNHGSCGWCRSDRTRNKRLVNQIMSYELQLWYKARCCDGQR